jgi:hypothetical protein
MMVQPIRVPPPPDLDVLQADLVELALGGTIVPDSGAFEWLEAVGVARMTDDKVTIADEDWLLCALPSPSAQDLLIRTLLRDPLYRLHVDLYLSEVVVAVGLSGRWSRLEKLLFEELAVLAPRLVAMVEYVRSGNNTLEHTHWREFEPLEWEVVSLLDERCWGVSGPPHEMFPILRTQYPKFASAPVFFRSSDKLVWSIVLAAVSGEAIRIPGERLSELSGLIQQGVPLWWHHLNDGQVEVTLTTPCRIRGAIEEVPTHAFSRAVSDLVREHSALLPVHPVTTRSSFWEITAGSDIGLAFVGNSSREDWPSDQDAVLRNLPIGERLADLVGSRRSERSMADPADEALRKLADHPLYGLWIQILLIEALDRELGEETLLYAPPTHAIVKDIEAATRVYYRPRAEAAVTTRPLLELGELDDVMPRVANSVAIRTVAAFGDEAGSWAMSLALLARVGLVQTRHDRWALSTHALDRLHGGGLMTGVIRRGRNFREQLHQVLEALWHERYETVMEESHA